MSAGKSDNAPRVIVIGFDGATLDLIEPWAKAGILPTFRRLMENGAWGRLQSTLPPVTPAAWSTLATGLNQGKHGVFDFVARKEGSYETAIVNAAHRHGAPFWRLLSQAGQRAIVFNVPATYPPDKVSGMMVSGLLTPTHATDAAWPPEVLDDLRQAVPDFSFYPPGIFSRGQEVEFVNDVLAWDRMTLRATEFLAARQPWDLLFAVFIGTDIVSHFMWRHMATKGASVPGTDPMVKRTLADAIQAVYRQGDGILSRLLDIAGDGAYVFVVSDHGFGPLDYYVHLNTWLAQKGYLKFKSSPFVQLKYLAYRLGITPLQILELLRTLGQGRRVQETASTRNAWLKSLVKMTFLSLADVDWSRTTAYSAGYGAPIFVNLRGREPQGIVRPGQEYDAIVAQLIKDLESVRHPDTGELFGVKVHRPEEIYSGPYIERAPDLLPAGTDGRSQVYGVHDFASNRWLEPSPDRTGTHRMDGILFVSGPGVRPGYPIMEAALWDVAPTILALTGVPIPKNVDGRVLTTALSKDLLSRLNITWCEPPEDGSRPSVVTDMSKEDERMMRERLQALGYID